VLNGIMNEHKLKLSSTINFKWVPVQYKRSNNDYIQLLKWSRMVYF